jgi:hypothetical protein
MTTRNETILHKAIALGALFSSILMAYSQRPAGPNRPAGVPDGYVITPFGYFHSSCVLRLGQGDTVVGGNIVQHADGSYAIIPPCSHPHYAVSGRIVNAGATRTEAPTINGWVESESATTNTAFGEIVASWNVPAVPTSQDGQTVYFFPGMEDENDVVTIIQPVLGWNMDDSDISEWSIASWNCCYNNVALYSTPVAVSPGDSIQGTVQSTCSAGTLSCSGWNITTYDESSGQGTTLSNTSSYGQTFNWAFGGVLEAYDIVQCTDYPLGGSISFTGIGLYDYNFNQISSPSWSTTYWYSGSPLCNYVAEASAAEVTLEYGPLISISPSPVGFNVVLDPPGPPSGAAQLLTVTNNGSSAVTLPQSVSEGNFTVEIGDFYSSLLHASANCPVSPASLGAGDNCQAVAIYNGATVGYYSASLTITGTTSNGSTSTGLNLTANVEEE